MLPSDWEPECGGVQCKHTSLRSPLPLSSHLATPATTSAGEIKSGGCVIVIIEDKVVGASSVFSTECMALCRGMVGGCGYCHQMQFRATSGQFVLWPAVADTITLFTP